MIAKIDVGKFKEVLNSMHMLGFPRTIGLPHQMGVWDFDSLLLNLIEHDGKNQLYISTNTYTKDMEFKSTKIFVRGLIYRNLFSDFDHKTKMENAQRDAILLSDELHRLKVNHVPTFSGGKGFHVHVLLKPRKFEYDMLEHKGEKELSNMVFAIQNKWKERLELKTMDMKCMGTPTRICRVPYSEHVDSYGYANGNVCCILTDEMLRWSLPDILAYAKNPDVVIPQKPYDEIDLFELVDRVGYDAKYDRCNTNAEIVHQKVNLSLNNELTIKAFYEFLMHEKPCVYNDMLSKNPCHTTRIAFAILCRLKGFDTEATNRIYEYLGRQIGYIDFHNVVHRRNQIRSIVENDNMVKQIKCENLKKGGICIGVDRCVKLRSGVINAQDIWN